MNPLFAFVLGLLVGWLIEWLIDYFYWRTRYVENSKGYTDDAKSSPEIQRSSVVEIESQPASKVVPDDLKVIKGIGTVIERRLNDAGVYTFEQLGNLSTAELRSILGNVIERLSNEESLLQQARDLARRK